MKKQENAKSNGDSGKMIELVCIPVFMIASSIEKYQRGVSRVGEEERELKENRSAKIDQQLKEIDGMYPEAKEYMKKIRETATKGAFYSGIIEGLKKVDEIQVGFGAMRENFVVE